MCFKSEAGANWYTLCEKRLNTCACVQATRNRLLQRTDLVNKPASETLCANNCVIELNRAHTYPVFIVASKYSQLYRKLFSFQVD